MKEERLILRIQQVNCLGLNAGDIILVLIYVLVLCCCITNYHRLCSLKHYTFIVSQFTWVRSLDMAFLGALLRVAPSCNQGVRQAVFSSGVWVLFYVHMVVGRIQFLRNHLGDSAHPAPYLSLLADNQGVTVGLQRLPTVATWPSDRLSHNITAFFKASRRSFSSILLRWSHIRKSVQGNNYSIDISYYFLHILLAKSESQVLLTLKGRGLHRGHDSLEGHSLGCVQINSRLPLKVD